ncbi:acyl-coenzyme A oxidase 3, peroxisomal-like isoform X2 [Rutidosis leptorrhynchoides]|uniref:acyl-coenzyme A oxidase 3, peroxisomal-like isoform X2 n=1 Tax=Rutidosis leptorrhynchoides TaxID=125765 RepID=UPI003A99EA78
MGNKISQTNNEDCEAKSLVVFWVQYGSRYRNREKIYDTNAQEFIISTPCESAQKYWIGGVANHATHIVVFSQLEINGVNRGVHAFIAQIRDENGKICQNVCIADCGHKTGSNGVDNGRIWYETYTFHLIHYVIAKKLRIETCVYHGCFWF